jgi:MerC mercury resistance protein
VRSARFSSTDPFVGSLSKSSQVAIFIKGPYGIANYLHYPYIASQAKFLEKAVFVEAEPKNSKTSFGAVFGADESVCDLEMPSRLTVFLEKAADRLGICLSALCVVHCLLTPFLLLLLPSVQLLAIHESYHEYMLVILPLLAVIAFIPGYRLHRDHRVFLWAIPGLMMIVVGALVLHDFMYLEIASSVIGSLFLIRAHLLNRRLCSCCVAGHVGPIGAFRPRKFKVENPKRHRARLLSAPPRKGRR